MNIQVSVQSWGTDCGPRPTSSTSNGGGTFGITQSGDHLTFRLQSQRTTRTCWSENRAVQRVSSSVRAGTWTIVCRTPAEDSRAETGRYTIQALGDDRLQFTDQSEYNWQLNESSCVATIRTTQSFTRVGSGAATPAPENAPRCTPGAAARIALRPARADVPPGGEQCFTARVVDAAGCPVRGRVAALRVADGNPGTISGLCYQAADSAGSANILASAGALRAEATVTVRSMDLSDLIARRTETGSVGSGTPDEDATSETAALVSTPPADEPPDLLVPSIAVGAALLLLIFGVVVLRMRSNKTSATTTRDVRIVRESLRAPAMAAADAAPAEVDEAGDLICPQCRRGYPDGTESCPHDGTALMPYKDFAAGPKDESKICPTCSKRFPATTKFCGEDGATLVPARPDNSTQG